MRSFLTLLVIVLAATSAWLWRALERQREHPEVPSAQVARNLPVFERSTVFPPGPETPVSSSLAASDHVDPHVEMRLKNGLIFSGNDPRLRQNAAYMDARRRYLEAAFAQRFPDLVRVLDVPEETAFRVVELSHEEQIRESGLVVDSSQPDFWSEQEQKAYESDLAIAALVGEAKLQRWKDYQMSIWERHQVRALRLELIDSGEPLANDEAEALIDALYDERRRVEAEAAALRGPTGGQPGAPNIGVEPDAMSDQAGFERRALKVARSLLSSRQYEVFREMTVRQRTAQDAMEEMHQIGLEVLN